MCAPAATLTDHIGGRVAAVTGSSDNRHRQARRKNERHESRDSRSCARGNLRGGRERAIDVSWRRCSLRRLPQRGAAPVSSRQVEVPDRRPDRVVADSQRRCHLFRWRRRQRVCGGRDRWPANLEAQDRRTRTLDPCHRGQHVVRGKLRRQASRARYAHRRDTLEILHRRRTAVRGKGPARESAEKPDDGRCFRRLPVEPGRRARNGVFRQRRRKRLCGRRRLRRVEMEIQDRRCRACPR